MFVFLSHASKDKPLLKPITAALIEAGIKVWLDKPSALGYSAAEINDNFLRLRAGGRWDDEIDDAKREAACILVCWSKRAEGNDALVRHNVWFEEASYGRAEKKLVACGIDGLNPGKLPGNHDRQQLPDIRDETELALIIGDVRRKMHEFNMARANKRQENNARRSPLAPYLVNRTLQEEKVEEALETVCGSGGVRPFFLLGPENECLDEFLHRLDRHTSKQCLGNGKSWKSVSVDWPDEAAERFAESYMRRLAKGMDRRGKLSTKVVAAELASQGAPIAAVSRMRAEDWKADEPKRVAAWLKFWQEMAREPGRRSIVPLLAIKLPKAEPGWKDVPGSGWFDSSGKKNKQIWHALAEAAKAFSDLGVTRTPILCPVGLTDSETWFARHFSAGEKEYAGAQKAMLALFDRPGHKKHGVPHAEFAETMLPLFQSAE